MIGRSPETFSLAEAIAAAGKWAAFEIYSPKTLPVHVIEAFGDTPEDCLRQLEARGLDPGNFEIVQLKRPF